MSKLTGIVLDPLGNQTYKLQYDHFDLMYDSTLHYPILCHWIETNEELTPGSTLVTRGDKFIADPTLNEINSSLEQVWHSDKYDRGHNCPAKDNEFAKEDEDQCFYYTNMTPQTPNLNRITWKDLEEATRALAKEDKQVEVWCGSFGDQGKIDFVTIPTYCWKIIKTTSTNVLLAYLMPNTEDVNQKHYMQYLTTVDNIRELSGLDLKEIF